MDIGIHVLGPGYGESIVLELPDGQIGVIDCYRNSLGRAVLTEFIRQHFGTTSLLFLAVSHPHADHCAGIEELLEHFSIQELWVFDSLQMDELRDYFRILTLLGMHDPVEADLQAKGGTVFRSLLALRKAIVERRRRDPRGKVRLLHAKESFTLCGETIRIRCLTPGSGSTVDYRERVATALRSAGTRRSDEPAGPEPALNQNLASAALLLEFGKTRVLLLADAERPLWQDWLVECADTPELRPQPVQLTKAAHHGSLNGYCQELYTTACADGASIVLLTPFSRSRSPLPSREGIDALRKHTEAVLCTNSAAAERSSAYVWAAPAAALPGLPPGWAVAIRKNAELARLLAPPYGPAGADPESLSLPVRWLRDCAGRPELLRLLHPKVGGVGDIRPGATIYDEFLVSLYFDEHGCEQASRRFVGPGAGMLQPNPAKAATATGP